MTTKRLTYSEIRNVIDTVPTQAVQAHYVVGAYQALMASIVADLPKHKQAEFIRSIESLAVRAAQIPSTY
jgi:hypothetical protein